MGERVMGERQAEPRWYRITFGRPRVWNGVVWLLLAACWFGVTLGGGGSVWGYLLAALWAVLGGVVIAVAARDLLQGRGAYAHPDAGRLAATSPDEPADHPADG